MASNKSSLRTILHELSNAQGIYSHQLGKKLTPELRERWQIPVGEKAEPVLQAKVNERLTQYISMLEGSASRGISDERFRTIAEVCYNIYKNPELTEEDRETLEKRQQWIAKRYKKSDRTIRRIFSEAVSQIEQRIAEGASSLTVAPLQMPTSEEAYTLTSEQSAELGMPKEDVFEVSPTPVPVPSISKEVRESAKVNLRSPSPGPKKKVLQYLLAFVSAMATTATLGFYVLPKIHNSESSKSASPAPNSTITDLVSSPNSTLSPNPSESSDCAPSEPGISITCIAPPDFQKTGKLSISYGTASSYVFAGSLSTLSALPAPPDFPEYERNGHCSKWKQWLMSQRMYRVYPSFSIGISSTKGELAVVKSIDSLVYRNEAITKGNATRIRCENGAGGNGIFIRHDTREKSTTLFDDTTGRRKEMPPASVLLDPTQPDYQGIVLAIQSRKKYLYEGTILITAQISGREHQFRLGTPKYPFRWVGGSHEDLTLDELGPPYGWSPTERRWIPVSD